MAQTYTLTTASARRLAAAADAIASTPPPEDKWYEPRFRAASAGGRMLLCKTTAAWTKGTSQTVDVYRVSDQTATGGTVTAINLAADIESGKWCGVQNGMLCWAECDDPPAGA
jgi:hypothetical protein